MGFSLHELESRAGLYCHQTGGAIGTPLGSGIDGAVWKIFRGSAVTALKISGYREQYNREIDCYERLSETTTRFIGGFNVPALYGFDDSLWAIEISLVTRPFILDFGKAYLDHPPDYVRNKIIMDDWRQNFQAVWGKHWPTVQQLLEILRKEHGIYYYDPSKGNIQFDE